MPQEINEEKTNIQKNDVALPEANETLEKKRTITSTLYPLPHKNSSIEQHIKIIKAYLIATNDGKKPVMYKDLANLVDFHYTYVSSNNKFLEGLGLIVTSGSHGMYVPTTNSIEFQRQIDWGQKDKALDILRDLVKASWFWQSARQVLLMREDGANEEDILNKLGADSKASPEKHIGSLKILLKYIEYVGLVKRDEKTNKIKMAAEFTLKESSTKEPITEKAAVPQINETEEVQITEESQTQTVQPKPTEPTHYREEPGHFSLRVKLDETSIQLLEEEIKYIKGKHALLQKSKKAGEESK
jgi:hypothetical protein